MLKLDAAEDDFREFSFVFFLFLYWFNGWNDMFKFCQWKYEMIPVLEGGFLSKLLAHTPPLKTHPQTRSAQENE